MKRAALLSLGLLPAAAFADEVFLRGGGRVSGTIVERTQSKVVLEVGPGLVALPMSRVERIAEGPSAVAEYRERARALSPADVQGWLALALWARERGLETQARMALEKALAADPANAAAHRALGHLPLDDGWGNVEESYRARGYVFFEGIWVTLAEREAMVRERAESAAAERARLEGEARLREAEARALEAEARARAAVAETRGSSYGVPLYPFYGGGTVVVIPVVSKPVCRASPAPAPVPTPRPRPATLRPQRGSRLPAASR